MRKIGIVLIVVGLLSIVGELKGIAFPTARWFFEASRKTGWLHTGEGMHLFPWFGWVMSGLLLACGAWILARSFSAASRNPISVRRAIRFREVRRGRWSLMILMGAVLLAALDQVVVGKRALAVHYDGQWVFPAFLPRELKNRDFHNLAGNEPDAPVDYRRLARVLRSSGKGRVILPPVPYDPTGDTLPPRSRQLFLREGLYYEKGADKPFNGLAASYYDVDEGRMHIRYTMRKGRYSGPAEGWQRDGTPAYTATYHDGVLVSEKLADPEMAGTFTGLVKDAPRAVKYHPAPPMPEERIWLGTTTQGYDVVAYLFGGLQVNVKAALLYIPAVYLIGVTLGLMMGYFGKWFDLIMQRAIEILTNVPTLFVIIIVSSMIPEKFRGLPVILGILIAFGWMGLTYLMRTAAYRDRERDYIAAAKVLGASTPRVLFKHLLPNTVSILVTVIPFSVSGLVLALTSLDYLGFGLPPEYASWGKLLNDGLANLSAPWLVTSAFVALVLLLTLITFVGEAVREAYDPKKFTYYR